MLHLKAVVSKQFIPVSSQQIEFSHTLEVVDMLPLVYSDDLTPYKSLNEEGVSIKLNTQNERLKLSMIEGCQSLHTKTK